MRRTLFLVGISVALIGSAFALQESITTETALYVADVERRPADGPTFGRLMPERAIRRRISGVAHLCCTAREDRSLDCAVALEWPENEGFGESALRLSQGLQLKQASYHLYQQRTDARVHMPVRFNFPPLNEEFTSAYARIDAEASGLCGENNAPMEAIVVTGAPVCRQYASGRTDC